MAKFTFGGGKSDEDDEINRKAHRELLEAQERRASEKQTERELSQNPDSAQSMEKHFSGQADKEREAKVNDDAANEKYRMALAAQRKDVESRRLGMGDYAADYATRTNIEDGAAGIVAAGGERKGGYVSLGSGAAGIVAAGGQKTSPHLGISSTFQDQLNVIRWGAGMQRFRTLVRQYERREKKKNDGGLTAARQSVTTHGYFPDRPMFKVGATSYNPMTFVGFSGAHPVTGLYRSAEQGWCQNDPSGAMTSSFERMMVQAGRKQRSTYLGGGG